MAFPFENSSMKILILILLLLSCGKSNSTNNELTSVEALTQRYRIPGLAGTIMKNDEVLEVKSEGVRKLGHSSPLTGLEKFHLGSCTKAMTATLTAIFIEEGKLSWNTPLRELFREIDLHPLFVDTTFETLLVHRAGLPKEHPILFEVTNMTPKEGRALIAKTLLKNPPLTVPDTKYQYSNYGYIIAGHVLEKISGRPWEDLMVEKIFKPLGMNSCGFGATSIPGEDLPTQPWGHIRSNGEIVPVHFDNPLTFGPASTVHCTFQDWSKFLKIHLKGFNGEDNILRKETYKKLHSIHPANDSTYTYGGWHLLQRNWADGPTLSHIGTNTLNYANVWLAPKKSALIMTTANIGGEEAFQATDALAFEMIKKHLLP